MSDPSQKVVAKKRVTPASKSKNTEEVSRPSSEIEVTLNGVRVEVSPELEAAVHRAYKGLCRSLPSEMTTTEAAEFLDVSRPFVIKLIQRKELPCRMVGTHRRIPSSALLEYREKMFQHAKHAADEMAQTSQELDLYEAEGPSSKAR